jgi:RNA polymerase sigma factor (TIGR02999 family)
MKKGRGDATNLLSELADGRETEASELFTIIYDDLRRRAHAYMRRERPGHTLQTTALVNEAYVKLIRQSSLDWESRSHFFRIAAKTMEHILIDYARKRNRVKGPGAHQIIPLHLALVEALVLSPDLSADYLDLGRSLERLSKLDPLQGEIVRLRLFTGRTIEEVADVLGISVESVKTKWELAKAWLYGDLKRRHERST